MSIQFDIERRKTDHVLVASILLLTGLGLVTLYSSSYAFSYRFYEGDGFRLVSRQIRFGAVGLALFLLASVINLEIVRKLIKPLVLGTIILCVLTFVPGIGVIKNGAPRWIGFKGYSFQPSELVKMILPLYLAHYFEKKKDDVDNIARGIIPPALITGVFFVLIFWQNNFSTAAFIAANALFMFFLAGMKFRHFFSALFMFVPTATLLVLKKEHRIRRFLSYIHPEFEPLGANYQVTSSVRTISSGGFWGKGLGQGTRKIESVPEVHSDFIFSSFAEESGFLGVLLFCLLFTVFAVRGYVASMENEKPFNRLLGCGLVTMIVSQVLLNIAVVSGALPPTGIPLPFFSGGGSSLATTLVMAGLIVNVSRSRTEKV
ncbi:MAG: putative lipid II flippase FtsW [Treponema sp.]|jgi:cell division protein FtsW|nr:putative lipid II flippase FtsW [Treponema sp.]